MAYTSYLGMAFHQKKAHGNVPMHQEKNIKNPSIYGFTLLELIITLALISLLTTIAIPNFMDSLRNNRLATAANELISAIHLARSEAIKRNQQVVVRKTGTNWEDGWQVFVDVDRDTPSSDKNTFNDDGDSNLCESNEDCVLRVYDALANSFTLRGNNNFTNFIRYKPTGESSSPGSFIICDNKDGNNTPEAFTAKLIIVNFAGRPRMGVDSDKNGIPEKNTGSEVTSCTSP